MVIEYYKKYFFNYMRTGAVAQARVGDRIPAMIDISRKKGSDSSAAKRSAIGVSLGSS